MSETVAGRVRTRAGAMPWVVALVALAAARGVWAQDGPNDDEATFPDSPAPAEQSEPPAPLPRPAPGGDPAWVLYHRAFSLAATGETERARAVLEQLAQEFPGHPAVGRARDVLRALDSSGASAPDSRSEPSDGDWDDPAAPERPEKKARAELALGQTFHGLATGIELCILIECGDAVAGTFLALGGAAGGVAISLVATRGGVTPGLRGLVNSGTFWGALNGALGLAVTGVDDAQGAMTMLLVGQYGGLGLGRVLWRFRPTDGQVALTNTVGTWSTILALEAYGLFAGDSGSGKSVAATALIAADAGLVAGALVSRKIRMSRSRTLVIDSGGILGGLLGAGTAVLIESDALDSEVGFGSMLGGTIAGLGAAIYFTRDWDAPPAIPARVVPIAVPGRGLGIGVSFDLDL